MTESRRPRLLPTLLAAVACLLVAFEFLAFQLTTGNDPALGSQEVAATAQKRPVVIDRRIIKRRVVHLPAREPAPVGGVAVSSGAAPVASSSGVPAPAPAPAPAVAPTPAPAPAPPVTASS